MDQVMSQWQTYPDFAHFFTALLDANDFSANGFVSRYTEATGKYISRSRVDRIHGGFDQPTYQFVADIADHALLFSDPARLRKANGAIPAGDYRVPLFAAAGIIEVTPESIAHWNEEVLARWQCQAAGEGTRLSWKHIMKKLIEFHIQGDRASFVDIADAANAHLGPDHQITRVRVNTLLNNYVSPTPGERLALGTAAGLTPVQIQLIETSLDNGTLLINSKHGPRRNRSLFSERLGALLDHLRDHDVSQNQLALQSICPGQSDPSLSATTLSNWKNGHVEPTTASLRGLVHGLRRYASIVPEEHIEQLVSSAGFPMRDLFATSHDIIAGINDRTRLKPLLSAIRNAVDIEVAVPALADHVEIPDPSRNRIFLGRVKEWEIEASPWHPSESDLMVLLRAYNSVLREKGLPELSQEEIRKVMEIRARDREEGGFNKRARDHKPLVARRTITPDFDSGPRRA